MKIKLILLLLFLPFAIKAQKIVRKTKYKTVTVYKKQDQLWPVTVSAFSPFLFHPGISVQTDYVVAEKRKEVNRRRLLRFAGLHIPDRLRTKSRYFLFQPGMALYNQKDFHSGVLIHGLAKYRWVRYKGFSYEVGLGLGALWTIYQGKTYVVKPDGSIKERSLGSRLYGTFNIAASIGYDFSKAKKWKHNGAIYLGTIQTIAFPLNTSIGPLGYLQLGYRFQIPQFTLKMNKICKRK